MQKSLVLILHDIRSGHNVGSLMRTSDGLGVNKVYMCGITPHPRTDKDPRPEHVIRSNTKEIIKTALGAETSVPYEYHQDLQLLLERLKSQGYKIYCLENNVPSTQDIRSVRPDKKIALVLGSETAGMSQNILSLADHIVEIPMLGSKNSLNVSVAGGIALYALTQGRN